MLQPDTIDVADLKTASVVDRICSVLEDVSLNRSPSPSDPLVRRYTEGEVYFVGAFCHSTTRAMQSRGAISRRNNLDQGETLWIQEELITTII